MNALAARIAKDSARVAALVAASDGARIAAFERDSKAFPPGTRVQNGNGKRGVVLPEKGQRGVGVATLRVQFDGCDFVSRMVPGALSRI